MAKIKHKLMRFQVKIVAVMITAILITSGLITLILFQNSRTRLIQNFRQQLMDIVGVAALEVDAEAHATLNQFAQEGNPTYLQIKGVLQKIRNVNPDFRYVYTMRQDAQGNILFVVDAETDPNNLSHLGDVYSDASPFLKTIFSTLDKPAVEPEFYTDRWGTRLSGYAPFYNSKGMREGVLGIDMIATRVLEREKQLMWTALLTFVALIPLMLLLGWLGAKWLSAPITKLILGTNKIVTGDLNHRIYLKTEDELAKLAETINEIAANYQISVSELEQRVAKHATEIKQKSEILAAVDQVSRCVSSVTDANQMIKQVVDLVKSQFNLYFVGLYLVDESGGWAELKAGSGDPGRDLLDGGYRIQTGTGMVGWCISQGQPRLAADVKMDEVYQKTSELPDTHSELSLPLSSRGSVIGAMTFQSEHVGFFDETLINMLRLIANQIANILDNTFIVAKYQTTLDTIQKSYGDANRMTWRKILQSGGLVGYRSEESGIKTIDHSQPQLYEATVSDSSSHGVKLHFPIVIRGVNMGTIEAIKPADKGEWTEEEIAVLKELTDHLSVAVDNARLYSDSQLRAERERRIADITAKVRASTNLDIILQTSIQELTRALHLQQGSILLKVGEGDIIHE